MLLSKLGTSELETIKFLESKKVATIDELSKDLDVTDIRARAVLYQLLKKNVVKRSKFRRLEQDDKTAVLMKKDEKIGRYLSLFLFWKLNTQNDEVVKVCEYLKR